MALHPSKTKLLDAALKVIRARGYAATTIDDVCHEAGVTKGSFFHHFKGKEELTVQATLHWSAVTGGLFAQAPYTQHSCPRERVLGYIDFRAELLQGEAQDFTCLLGTLVQETYGTHPALREACRIGIEAHAAEVSKDIALAKARFAPGAAWSAQSLALHTQAVLQGAFVLAKAVGNADVAVDSVLHLRRYIEHLFPLRAPANLPFIPSSPHLL